MTREEQELDRLMGLPADELWGEVERDLSPEELEEARRLRLGRWRKRPDHSAREARGIEG